MDTVNGKCSSGKMFNVFSNGTVWESWMVYTDECNNTLKKLALHGSFFIYGIHIMNKKSNVWLFRTLIWCSICLSIFLSL